MKEIKDILIAFDSAQKAGKRTALASVVHVEGSSYRRPGARMLVTEDGQLTGAISGGCLEGDALRKALLAINQQQNKLVTYDTTDEDDAKFGVQLGCNGIVHILFEPIDPQSDDNPITILQKLAEKRQNGIIVTLFSLDPSSPEQPGTCRLSIDNHIIIDKCNNVAFAKKLDQDLKDVYNDSLSATHEYFTENIKYTAFIEFLRPSLQLVIAGAGNDALPVHEFASLLGWDIIVADGRANQATSQRFPKARKVIVCKPDKLLEQIHLDEQTVFVLMTHNFNYDRELLALLLKENTSYIGSLGPKKKLQRMLDELRETGLIITEADLENIYGPVGLDLGSESPEEIALSMISEIKAVLSGRSGNSLRDKAERIHDGADKENQPFTHYLNS